MRSRTTATRSDANRRDATVLTNDLRRAVEAGYLISDIARLAHLHPVGVGEISRGKRKTVSVFTLGRLLSALERIDNGEVALVPRPPRPATRKASDQACGRGHDREQWTGYYKDGSRYCKACQKLSRTARTRRS